MFIYSLYCKSLNHYNPVFSASSDNGALYMVRQSVNLGSDINLISDISDFELHCLGEFDTFGNVMPSNRIVVCDDLTSIPGIRIPDVSSIKDVGSLEQSYNKLNSTYSALLSDFKLLKAELDAYKNIYGKRKVFFSNLWQFIKNIFKKG